MLKGSAVRDTESALDQKSDDVLITLFQGGEEEVFRYLVDRYSERVRNLIYSIFNDSSLVDDLAQEVFIRAYEALPKFRFESSFYTWLYRITVNKCRDELRKKKMRKFLSLHAMLEASSAELQSKIRIAPEDTSSQDLVARGLQQLPERLRIPIILKDIEGRTYEEMAEIMQCEIGTVKSRLSRARSMLRKILKPLLDS